MSFFYSLTSLEKEKHHKLAKLQAQFANHKFFVDQDEKSLLIAKLTYFYKAIVKKTPKLVPEKFAILETILDSLVFGMDQNINPKELEIFLDANTSARHYLVLFKDCLPEKLQQQLFHYEIERCAQQAGSTKRQAIKEFKNSSYTLGSVVAANKAILCEGRTGRIVSHFLTPKVVAVIDPPIQKSYRPEIGERRDQYKRMGTLAELALRQFNSTANSLRDGLYRWFSWEKPYKPKPACEIKKAAEEKFKDYLIKSLEIIEPTLDEELPLALVESLSVVKDDENVSGLAQAKSISTIVAAQLLPSNTVYCQPVRETVSSVRIKSVECSQIIDVTPDSDRQQPEVKVSADKSFSLISALITGSLGEIAKDYNDEMRTSMQFGEHFKIYEIESKKMHEQQVTQSLAMVGVTGCVTRY